MLTEPGRPGLRERQRQETHLLIRRTAFDLTMARGAAAVSVKTICDAAGVSARTFFNHFHSKDEALVPDFPDFSPEAVQAFMGQAEPELVPALETLLRSPLAAGRDGADSAGPEALRTLIAANPDLLPRMLAVFEARERLLAELVARRTGRRSDDLFCVVAAVTTIATMRAAYNVAVTRAPGALDVATANRPAELEVAIAEAFSVLRQLTTPDSGIVLPATTSTLG